MKKIISIVLTPVLVLSLCCSLAFAAAPSSEVEAVEPTDATTLSAEVETVESTDATTLPAEVETVEPTDATTLPAEVETVKAAGADAPQYVTYRKSYKIDLQNNTYVNLMFTMADKGGKTYFEGLESITFSNTNPNGSHWKIVEHSYKFNNNEFYLYLTLQDMEGNTPSSDIYIYDMRIVTVYNVLGDTNGSGGVMSAIYVGESENIVSIGIVDN